jgi:hypothetical protein
LCVSDSLKILYKINRKCKIFNLKKIEYAKLTRSKNSKSFQIDIEKNDGLGLMLFMGFAISNSSYHYLKEINRLVFFVSIH